MKKTFDSKNLEIVFKKESDKDIENKIESLTWEFANKNRVGLELQDCLSAVEYLLYCAYVSSNWEFLGIKEFDDDYATEEVVFALGNKYLATDYLTYFENFSSDVVCFPEFDSSLCACKVDSALIKKWFEAFDNSCLALKEKTGFPVAHAIHKVLSNTKLPQYERRAGGEFYSTPSMAELITTLGSVEGCSVYDFACGSGTVLSEALRQGATSVSGSDLNSSIISRAKLLCFFANPEAPSALDTRDMLDSNPSTANTFDRVLVQPPFHLRMRSSQHGRDEKILGHLQTLSDIIFDDARATPTTGEEYAIAKAIHDLKPGGTAVVQVAMGSLFRTSRVERAFRRALFESGYIKAVFELPSSTQYGTAIEVALIIIEKPEKKVPGHRVMLVDMKSRALEDEGLFEKGRHAGKTTITKKGIAWAKELLCNPREIPMVSALVSFGEFFQSGASLLFSRYGDVVDYEAARENVRNPKKILGDISARQSEVIVITQQISMLLSEIHDASEEDEDDYDE